MSLTQLGTGDERGDLLLLDDLPVDEGLDVRVVEVETHHLGGAAGGAPRLDRARAAVAHAEEAHKAAGLAATGEPLVLAADLGEVGADAGAVLEDAGLASPEVHDAALVDEVVLHAEDEAGVGLWSLVSVLALAHLAGLGVHIGVTLGDAFDAVSIVEAGVEPLRAVRRGNLLGEHVAELVIKSLGVFGGVEVAEGLAPVSPAASKAVEHFAGVGLEVDVELGVGAQISQIGLAAEDARLAEILLREDVGGDLRPLRRDHDAFHLEHAGPIGIFDLAAAGLKGDSRVRVVASSREIASDLHPCSSCVLRSAEFPGIQI